MSETITLVRTELIHNLRKLKASIYAQATDTLWLQGSSSQTVCEKIDEMLYVAGMTHEEIEQDNDQMARGIYNV